MKITKRIGATFVAAVLALGTVVLASPAPAAEAHTPRVAATCSTWTVDLTSYGQGYQVSVFTDSQEIVTNAPIDDRYSNSGSWPAESQTHHLRIQITRLDGRGDRYTGAFTSNVNGCQAPPVFAPQIQDYLANCDARFVLDNGASNRPVVYTINGQSFTVAAGVASHVGPIAPSASFGYTVTTDTGRSWSFMHTDEQLAACAGPAPETRVQYIYGEWADAEVCTTPGQATVTQSQTVTARTTTYVREGVTWVPVTTDALLTTKERERDLTEQERIACAGEQPAAEVVVVPGAWTDGIFECGDTDVTETRTVTTTTTPYVLSEGYVWVAGESTAVTTSEPRTRALTEAELEAQAEACTVEPPVTDPPSTEPPVTEPPATTPPTSTPPTAPTPTVVAAPVGAPGTPVSTLPQTGFEGGPVVAIAALVFIALGLLVGLIRRTRSTR